MFIRWRQCVGLLPIFLGACAHLTTNTNQFYLAQTYLPVANPSNMGSSTLGSAKCAAGPVIDHRRDAPARRAAKLLPGMALHIIETTYTATTDDSVPIISDWTWVIPETQAGSLCADQNAVVPTWKRPDLLTVRNLLSGAQLTQTGTSNTNYFQQAVTEACPSTAELPDCLTKSFLDVFVRGLTLNMRAQSDRPNDTGQTPGPLEPAPYPEVLAKADAPAEDATAGFARWYSTLGAPRRADLFAKGEQATSCARAFRDGATPDTQDIEVCKFALASLEWKGAAPSDKMPGATLRNVSDLWLLRSGDPLLLMQPQAYRNPLDVSGEPPCANANACKLRDRMAQGFVDIEVLIPIYVGNGNRQMVPIGLSVADYERSRNVTVKAIRRSADWLPSSLMFDKGKPIDPKSGQRITIRFGNGRYGVVIAAAADDRRDVKADILFAPGDTITLSGAR